jgi:hypothetical protein
MSKVYLVTFQAVVMADDEDEATGLARELTQSSRFEPAKVEVI